MQKLTRAAQALAVLAVLAALAMASAQAQEEAAPEPQEAESSSSETEPTYDEEVIVEGVKSADLNAREAERMKDAFSSVIAQDDAGNFADQNVAESLQRLPGITLQKNEGEGQFITLRGLGPGFVSVNMNGSELASASGDTRAVGLDSLPADMLGSIEVFKSLTPDMDLNSIAGTVNVKTVSAFDKGKDTMRLRLQESYQGYKGVYSPRIALDGTQLFADDTIGIGYSLSWEKRETVVYQIQHHSESLPRYLTPDLPTLESPYEGQPLLAPFNYEARQENAERTRTSASLDLGWRPNGNSEYTLKTSYTRYRDLDIALREYYRFEQAGTGEIAYVHPESGLFGVVDADLQQQYFIQDGKAETRAVSFNGNNLIGDWTVDYDLAYSESEWFKPNGRRVQFRIGDLPMLGVGGPRYITGTVVDPDALVAMAGASSLPRIGGVGTNGYQLGESYQPNLLYDNLFIEDSFRNDSIEEFSLNLRRDFNLGKLNYIKFGATRKDRERDRNKDRWSVVPYDYTNGCEGDTECLALAGARLRDFDTYRPEHPDIQHEFITQSQAEYLLSVTSPIAQYSDPLRTGQDSTADDYRLTEDTSAAYLMAEFQLADDAALIAGVRYASTEFESTGNFTIRNDRFEVANEPTVLDIAVPLEDTSNRYSDWFPSLHLRYEPRDDLLVRAALWTSFTRPGFDQTRAYAQFAGRIEVCNDVESSQYYGQCSDDPTNIGATGLDDLRTGDFYVSPDNVLELGNPNLAAMTSTNFDASISWYAADDLYMQAAVFYKDIDDFIVNVSGVSSTLDALPVRIPTEQVPEFYFPEGQVYNNVNYATNGQGAKVYGVELTYSQYFHFGHFVQMNATLMDSSANIGETIRASKIKLPEQADEVLNLTLGWENDRLTLRLIGNYRSEILQRVGACSSADIAADAGGVPTNCMSWADVYESPAKSLDFKATYDVNNWLNLYFDAINLTEEKTFRYFVGNEYSRGRLLFQSEDYGTSFQFGMRLRLM